jgi:hypothetical protein
VAVESSVAPRARRLAVLLPLACGAASLAVWWQRWIDPAIDSGRELDVPARIAAGERIYRDLAYPYGPLAPWVNGAAVALFGRRFVALEAAGVALGAVVIFLLHRLVLRAGSRASALAAASLAAAVCTGNVPGIGFVLPYAFANLYALAGTLLAALGLVDGDGRRGPALLFLGSTVALLSRPEYGIAVIVIAVTAAARFPRDGPRAERSVFAALAASVIVSGGLWALSVRGLDSGRLMAGPLLFLHPPAEWKSLYRNVAGISTPLRTAGKVLLSSAALGGLALALLGWTRLSARCRTDRGRAAMRAAWWGAVLAATVAALAIDRAAHRDWKPMALDVLVPLPALAAGLAAGFFFRRRAEQARARFLLCAVAVLWSARVAFSMTLGFRMFPYHGPALPAAIGVLAFASIDLLGGFAAEPAELRRNASAAFVALAAFYLLRMAGMAARNPARPVRTAAGTLRLGGERASAVLETIRFLRSSGASAVASFPEAGFFSFVTGIPDPLREEQVLPGSLGPGEEAEIVARLRSRHPAVLVMNRPTLEFGRANAVFGRDYAREIFRTIETDYECRFSNLPDGCSTPVGAPAFFVHGYVPKKKGAS